jgi:hypothetical protein
MFHYFFRLKKFRRVPAGPGARKKRAEPKASPPMPGNVLLTHFSSLSIKEAVSDRFDRRPPPPVGAGRVKVRDRLRQMLEEDQKRELANTVYLSEKNLTACASRQAA